MQEGTNARQQVVERIRQSTSILVAVGNSPSVDALAASLGLTLMLNKLNKHTTAVFSGVIPQAIQFLEPNKSFENNVDALRDFIISLDKEKADRLRYKVEDDVVRIFITPYKTSIGQADLQFSQGDFNVDLIIALGVEKREDLDKAIVAHGRILHDATVITVNADNQRSTLGSIDWNDPAASSLCEMLVGASEVFQQPGLLDAQISTALLTGIVASTDRFSNPRTSPRVMTMAAQLMAAGANQQLIATNLEKAKTIAAPAAPAPAGPVAKQQASAAPTPMPEEPPKPKKEPGELDIVHEKDQPKPPPAATPVPAPVPAAPNQTEQQQEKELEAALPAPQVQHNLLPEVTKELEAAAEEEPGAAPKAPGSTSVNDGPVLNEGKKEGDGEGDYLSSHGSWKGKRLEPPTLGGTLNATTEEAHEASAKAEDADRNKKLLTHPDDAPQTKSKRSRGKRGRGGSGGANDAQTQAAPVTAAATAAATPALPAEPVVAPLPPAPAPVEQAPVVDAPVMPPQPAAAPALEPQSAPSPAPAPAMPPVPELPPAPAPLPPAPEPAPVLPPAPEPLPAPAPEAPAPPAPFPEPAAAPATAPLPEPAPVPTPPAIPPAPEPHVDEQAAAASAAEAAAAAKPAESAVGDLDSAREAVSAALDAQPFNPAGQPAEDIGAQPLPAMPAMPVAEPLSPAALQQLPPAPETPPVPPVGELPPMPPMPPLPQSGADLPPAPDLPGLNAPLPPINEAPAPEAPQQPPAAPAADDPKQFKIPGA